MTERTFEERKAEFVQAFKEMQSSLPLIDKNTSGFNYKYAPLEHILEKWEPVFDKHNFLLRQKTEAVDRDMDRVTTTLTHIPTGVSDYSSLTIPVSDDYQKVGSGITYYRRYTLCALVAKCPVREDFDGLKNKPTAPKKSKSVKKEGPLATSSHYHRVREMKKDKLGDETEGHVAFAFEEFVKAAETVSELEKFWHSNSSGINKLDKDRADRVVEAFKARKNEILEQQKEKE